MANRMRAFGVAGLMAAVGIVAVAAQQSEPKQEPKNQVVETKSQMSRGGDDPNIKSTTRVNNAKKETPAPPSKGGEKPRGQLQTCVVHVDNRTPWYIHIYIDGDYSGLMPPWGDLYDRAIAGTTVFYGRANFDDGSARTWGPWRFSCPPGMEYTWRLGR
jgi:hypothetical protein